MLPAFESWLWRDNNVLTAHQCSCHDWNEVNSFLSRPGGCSYEPTQPPTTSSWVLGSPLARLLSKDLKYPHGCRVLSCEYNTGMTVDVCLQFCSQYKIFYLSVKGGKYGDLQLHIRLFTGLTDCEVYVLAAY